jgi:hypothetical protein
MATFLRSCIVSHVTVFRWFLLGFHNFQMDVPKSLEPDLRYFETDRARPSFFRVTPRVGVEG